MTLEIAFLLAILAAMAVLFLTEKLPIELTAFTGLVILMFAGFVPAEEAFKGFSSPAVITMLSIFFLSAALLHTGVADRVGARIHRVFGSRQVPLLIAVIVLAGTLSSVMNNVAATAVLLPAVASICRRTGVSPSRLLIPLSFGTILGGTTTLIGTPPNILAAEMLRARGYEPFGFFDFMPLGLVLLGTGMVFLVIFGRRLLPDRGGATSVSRRSDLIQVYQLHETLFSIQIPEGSQLDRRTLQGTSIGSTLGVRVVGILRGGKRHLAPEADTVLFAGDILLVQGRPDDVRELFRVAGSEFAEARPEDVEAVAEQVSGFTARLRADSDLRGQSLREMDFRQRFGGIVIGLKRDGKWINTQLGTEVVGDEDEILALGTRKAIDEKSLHRHFTTSSLGKSQFEELHDHLFVLGIPSDSGLVGRTIGKSRIGELVGLTICGIFRGEESLLGLEQTETIRAGDRLLVAGEPSRIRSLLSLGSVQLQQEMTSHEIESDGVGVVEASVSPRSRAAGKTLGELEFREKTGLHVLALWREGELLYDGLGKIPLRFGDALLLHGPWKKIHLFSSDRDFLVLTSGNREERRTKKAPFALASLFVLVGLLAIARQPVHVSAFVAATFAILARTITMEEAYAAVEWRVLFLVATLIPLGVAMETSGAANLLSVVVTSLAGPLGPYGVLAGLVVLASLLSQTLDGAPSVILLAPVALNAAEQLGIHPHAVMMAISLAASAAFMTPFSHKANLLVMGAGGYRVKDYLKVGTPLTILQLVLIVLLVPVFFPLYG